MTPSEKYVASLCRDTFLPFWSHPNPIGKKGKECCDLLVICQNIVIIVSVKEVHATKNKDEEVNYARWNKDAIDKSINQIYGAERFLNSVDTVQLKNRETIIALPPKENRVYYRIAIAFGGKEDYPILSGNFGKGFIHVFEEEFTPTVLSELDTISDFTDYLRSKEKLITERRVLLDSESDLLGFYLQYQFDDFGDADLVQVSNGIWEKYIGSQQYKEWRDDISISFMWDQMVKSIFDFHVVSNPSELKRDDLEEATRLINMEPRVNRIVLGEVVDNALNAKGLKARFIKPFDGREHGYVILPLNSKNWSTRKEELIHRSYVARVVFPDAKTVIGLGIGKDEKGQDYFDLTYLYMDEIEEEDKMIVRKIQKENGYFVSPKEVKSSELK